MERIEGSRHSSLWSRDNVDARIAEALGDQGPEYLKYRIEWKRGAVDRDFPLHLDFELNGACNMKCPMCTYALPETKNQGKESWMSLDRYRAILEDAVPRGLKAVALNGINEPLLRRDLPDFVRVAKQCGVLDIMFHTNGMLLTEAMSEKLIDSGLTKLMVSIDAATQPTYDKIRVGGNLPTVRRNLVRFVEMRGLQVLPAVCVCFVKMDINAHELPEFFDQWSAFVDFFAVQEYMNVAPERIENHAMANRRPAQEFRCQQPFQRMRISWNGSVRPCCAFYGDKMTAGRVEDPIHETWTNGLMGGIRQIHREGRWRDHPVCQECVLNSYIEESN
jgi:radical SAM protein with 4Fe4S-binding SPASM domain